MTQQLRVTQIARETGGEAFFPTSPKEIHEFYAKILDELGSRYTIGYTPVVRVARRQVPPRRGQAQEAGTEAGPRCARAPAISPRNDLDVM